MHIKESEIHGNIGYEHNYISGTLDFRPHYKYVLFPHRSQLGLDPTLYEIQLEPSRPECNMASINGLDNGL